MRPRLASLALLLLALCRPASAGRWVGLVTDKDSDMIFKKAAKDVEAKKLIEGYTDAILAKLEAVFGNSLHALMLKGAAKFDTLPDYYKKALLNGVRCELADAETVKNIVKEQYGATDGKVPAAKLPAEKDFAKANHGIDCAGATADACLCTEEKPLIYCLAKKIAGADAPGTCFEKVIDEAKNFGKKGLWKSLTEEETPPEGPKPSTFEEEVNSMTRNESPDAANLFCDTSNPAVLAITAKLYASDGFLWTGEAASFAEQGSTIDKECEKDEVKNNELGECMCSKTTGRNICAMIVYGKLFKKTGYIDCAPTPAKFVSAKKGATLAAMGGGPAPGSTAAPPAATTAATGGAATTSSLLLAPLAAAAAALLLL